ncbi:hypothetical protein A5689_19570 [Mycobacterium intracellulare subsp. yongonense]|nr:hypothetical protein A5689_19570 [Mycobacterium intracellulare subsp. yongonense]
MVASEHGVHLEWWYDLDRPFLAEVDLLAAGSSYSTSFVTEDGVFAATVRLPRTPDVEGGLADYLAPPRDWAATLPTPGEEWGIHYKDHTLGFKGVVIKRLAFSIQAGPEVVEPAIRSEWGQDLLAVEILNTIDTWWENVRTWLEIATNQRLAQVGHEASDWLNPNTRTSIWTVDESGEREPLRAGGTVVQGPERVLGVTATILRDCLALAHFEPPLAWTLLRDARALQNANQYRRSVMDAATAAELAATKLVDDLLVGTESGERARLLRDRSHQGLGGKAVLLRKLGQGPPEGFKADLVDRRNDAVHEGIDLKYLEWQAAFRAALALVEQGFPLPTPPGSSGPLTCYWSRTIQAHNVHSWP